MATPESKVKAKCTDLLKAVGVYYFFPVANGMGRAGIPDIICCARGKFLAIECKAGKGTTTALQKKELAAIEAAGGVALVINELNLTLLGDTIKELLS
jgi:Holliday junction resolvase